MPAERKLESRPRTGPIHIPTSDHESFSIISNKETQLIAQLGL